MRGIHIRLMETSSQQVLVRYDAVSSQCFATGLIIGAAYRLVHSWGFKAMGDVLQVDSVQELARHSCQICAPLLKK